MVSWKAAVDSCVEGSLALDTVITSGALCGCALYSSVDVLELVLKAVNGCCF